MPSTTERTPLLWSAQSYHDDNDNQARSRSYQEASTTKPTPDEDPHSQFCFMTGTPSSETTPDGKTHGKSPPRKSLYGRATRQLSSQSRTYYATASLSNTMLLSQVILGAALTALGASESSHILITVFGAMNTIIAGLVAYLKSRGQPMRARMYRDDLERVVDEIENSEIMWLGISKGVHGYEDIDTGTPKDRDDGKDHERNPNAVTVRSEVARLTRLYDRAVRNNTANNPDMYMTGAVDLNSSATLRSRVGGGGPAPVVAAPVIAAPAASANPTPAAPAAPPAPIVDPDESPATAPPKPAEPPKPVKDDNGKKDDDKQAPTNDPTSDAKKSTNGPDTKATTGNASDPGDSISKPGTSANGAPSEDNSAQPSSLPSQIPAAQPEQPHDPDAEPFSDANVPLKKIGDDGTS